MKRLYRAIAALAILIPIAYFSFVILLLSATNTMVLTSYAMVEHRWSNLKTLPIPFGQSIALHFVSHSISEEIDYLSLDDILMLPGELDKEGSYQGYSLVPNATELSFSVAAEAIDLGVDIDRLDSFGCTSMQRAAWRQDMEVVEFLSAAGGSKVAMQNDAKQVFCRKTPSELLKSLDTK